MQILSSIIRPVLLILLLFFSNNALYAQKTSVQGVVRDSTTNEPIEYATVYFEGTTTGELTNENGEFSLNTNSPNKIVVHVSLMGYDTRRINVPSNQRTKLDIKLQSTGVRLKEIVIQSKKEKYSKKDNPAVELIKKVIAHKYDYLPSSQDYYMNDEYEKTLFALNDYKNGSGLLKGMNFLSKYADTSLIDHKTVLPFSIRETMSNVFYRKTPQATRRVITAHKIEGLDQDLNTESIDGIIAEVFKDINLTDNTINLLMSDFISPLSSTSSVNFYKWYIIDTISINQADYIHLGFIPFNTSDVGFTGNLYVKADSTYAIKRVSLRVPSKINVNFLDEMLITQEFQEKNPNLWVPEKITTAMDLSVYGLGKVYVEKERIFKDYLFNIPIDAPFQTASPVSYLADYKKRSADYWVDARAIDGLKNYKMADMVKELRSNKLIDISFKIADLISTGYVSTNPDEDKNKVDLGTLLTFYSYNKLEGNRLRLTASTTKNFHPHLFLYGYGAYGTKDGKPKYYGEATWAFNKKQYHKEEFPKNNLSFGYKYDINALGQRFMQAERDNLFLSLLGKTYDNLTYNRMAELNYVHEYYNGFSFLLFGKTYQESPAGNLKFEYFDENGNLAQYNNIITTEVGIDLRLALKQNFFQKRRKRKLLPSDGFTFAASYHRGLKDALNGQYDYDRVTASVDKQFWIAPYGRLGFMVKGEKIWGVTPFPLLLSANANSSITLQKGSFNMLKPLEFMNDSQLSWDINYRSGGWLFNRIPLLKLLKCREIIEFRGFWGNLSKKNDPELNPNLLLFPENVYRMDKDPYMEYSIGVENLFNFFRVDYVRRMTYLDHPDIEKGGFRLSFELSF
ncbi:MAG: hypothetical protein RL662_1270 [Bacteroidota bacterium]|jgi:hypothetical protein